MVEINPPPIDHFNALREQVSEDVEEVRKLAVKLEQHYGTEKNDLDPGLYETAVQVFAKIMDILRAKGKLKQQNAEQLTRISMKNRRR